MYCGLCCLYNYVLYIAHLLSSLISLFITSRALQSTLFPYTTLFRSLEHDTGAEEVAAHTAGEHDRARRSRRIAVSAGGPSARDVVVDAFGHEHPVDRSRLPAFPLPQGLPLRHRFTSTRAPHSRPGRGRPQSPENANSHILHCARGRSAPLLAQCRGCGWINPESGSSPLSR